MTMTLVETITVGSGGAASIEFTGIAGDLGKDLVLLVSSRLEGGAFPNMTINGTSANYAGRRLTGGGNYVSSGSSSGGSNFNDYSVGNTATANTFSSNRYYFSKYASSTAKSISAETVNENNDTSAVMTLLANRWNNTDAITSIELNSNDSSNEFAEHTTASLYSIS